MVIAPEHPIINTITTKGQKDAVSSYIQKAKGKSDLERAELIKKKQASGRALMPSIL